MIVPETDPIRDPARLAALKQTGLLDSPIEVSFDRLTRLASRLLNAPVALVSFVDIDRQFFKSSIGLPSPWAEARQTPLSHSFCQHVVISGEPLIAPDARQMPMLQCNRAISELGVIAYLGVPLVTEDGEILGSFCVIDGQPRSWTVDELLLLRDLADSVTSEIRLRVEKAELERAEVRLSVQHAAALILAEANSFEEALGPLLKIVGEGLGYDVGEFWGLDPATGFLRRDPTQWISGPTFAAFASASKPFRFSKGEGLPGRVWASEEPSWIEDFALDDNFVRRELADDAGLKSGFGFPVSDGSGLVGVMTFFNRETIPSDGLLLQALTTLSRQLGQFVVRKAAEDRVARLNAQLGAVLDAATHVAIIASDANGKVVTFNAGAERMLGYDRDQVIDHLNFDAFLLEAEIDLMIDAPRLEISALGAFLDQTRREARIETDWSRERDLTFVRKDGVRLTASVVLRVIRDARGEVAGLLGIAADMTDRRFAESELRKFEALVEHSGDFIAMANFDGKFTYINPAGRDLVGRDRPELYLDDLLDDQCRSRAIVSVEKQGFWFGEGAIQQERSESPIVAEFNLFRVNDTGNGEPLCVAAIIRDISDRRRSERLLRESELRFRQSFENAPIGMALVTPDGRMVRVNRAICEIMGYSELQLLGMDFQSITHPDDLENDLNHLRRLLDGEIQTYQIEKRYYHSDGRTIWALLGVSLVRDSMNRPLHCISQIQDITDRKQFEAALHLARDGAMDAARAKSDFLANMSHEVRTPMAAVLGYSDMLLNPRLLQGERDQALQAIRRNGSHLLQIINDILDLSKIEAGRMELERIRYSPWQVALEVASALRIRADEKRVTLVTRAQGPLPISAIIDPTRIRQILVNLVSNAIKFSEPDSQVVLEMEAVPGSLDQRASLRLSVEDDGIGMTTAQVEQLFIPFQQADSSTTRKFGGTGLGLSISRRLTEAMDGTITVQSEIGRGSCFTVQFPVDIDDQAGDWLESNHLAIRSDPADPVQLIPLGQVLSGRILLAEDNPDNQKILLYYLCRMGLEVVIVDNGRQAVEKALRGQYDLVLMDMQMPELDGYGATSSLRRSGFQPPIIALTAHAMPEDRDKCLRVGCTDFLTKPVEAKVLASVLSRHLGTGQNQFALPHDPIASLFQDDPGLSSLIRSFVQALPERVDRFRSMMASGDLPGVGSLAHQIRGVGGMYGYPSLTETAALIEDAVLERQESDLLEELVEEFADMVIQVSQGLSEE